MSSAVGETAVGRANRFWSTSLCRAADRTAAFTWGVLDRLLEEPWIRIDAISGTSAGAMNAAVLADGWLTGGADGARAALDAYCGVFPCRRLQSAASVPAGAA